jgi:hypothetical protein
VRVAIEKKAQELFELAKNDDADAIQKGLEEINEVAKPLAEIMLDKVARAMVTGKKVDSLGDRGAGRPPERLR